MSERPIPPQLLRVLRLLSIGATESQIAQQLAVGAPTVKAHKQALFDILGVHTAHGAVGAAYQRGFLAVDPDVAEAAELLRHADELGYRLAVVRWDAA